MEDRCKAAYVPLLGALLALGGCSPSGAASTCDGAGGACVLGGTPCARVAMSAAQDCNPTNVPGGAFCCIDVREGGASLVSDAAEDGDAGSCVIAASSYDQSCDADTDCVEVTSTDYCSPGCLCGGSAINMGSLAAFEKATAATPLGSGAIGGGCPCAAIPGPCCRSGRCTATCGSATDTLPACADAGGTCVLYRTAGSTCTTDGPPGACAYADEVCCVN